MTAKWIQEAALEAHPPWENGGGIDVHESKRAAFIAGVELGIAKAGEAVRNAWVDESCNEDCHNADEGYIAALGSDNEEE